MQTGFKESVTVLFGAILIFCIDMIITSITMGLMIWFGELRAENFGNYTPFYIAGLLSAAAASVFGGYVVAAITKDKVYATATGFLLAFGSIAVMFTLYYATRQLAGDMPSGSTVAWPSYIITSLIDVALCTAGGYIWERKHKNASS